MKDKTVKGQIRKIIYNAQRWDTTGYFVNEDKANKATDKILALLRTKLPKEERIHKTFDCDDCQEMAGNMGRNAYRSEVLKILGG